jgi:H+-transporting ATPase
VALSSAADVLIIGNLAAFGILMTALPVELVGGILVAAVVFAFVLDTVKVAVFARLKMT